MSATVVLMLISSWQEYNNYLMTVWSRVDRAWPKTVAIDFREAIVFALVLLLLSTLFLSLFYFTEGNTC